MQAASAAISLLGFELDLIWNRVLTCMHWRSAARSGGAILGLAGVGSWASEREGVVVARSLRSKRERERDRERERERERATGAITTARKKTKGNGVNPAPGRPIYRGVH
jgi:hypothetical protein